MQEVSDFHGDLLSADCRESGGCIPAGWGFVWICPGLDESGSGGVLNRVGAIRRQMNLGDMLSEAWMSR